MTASWLNHFGGSHTAPRRHALITAARTWTYAALVEEALAVAARLAAWGVKSGDRVAMLSPNSADYVLLVHALLELGAALVPLNTRLTPNELRYQVQTAAPQLLIDAPETEALGRELSREVAAIPFEVRTFRSVHLDPVAHDQALNDDAAIIFTSGTSGRPKGARLTRRSLVNNALYSNARLSSDTPGDDRWLLTLPLYHVGGLSIVYRSFIAGQTLIVYEGSFEPERLALMLHQHQITHVSLVPTQLYRMLEAGIVLPSSLRVILLGGAAAAPDLLRRAFDLGLPIAPTYGMTEAASQIATLLPDDARHKPGSVGKALSPQTRIWVIDESGADLPANEIGEIVIQSDTLMRGYLNEPDTASLAAFRTGDLGYVDADGDLWLVQRRTDLIISGGENVYPTEVENVLRQHPTVMEACVVGLPDAEWGQIAAAAVVPKFGAQPAADALMAHCKAHLASYKCPRRVVLVESLPQTASGKIIRREVAALFA
jgi:O-succinylbenzoic acid--CoA ligase